MVPVAFLGPYDVPASVRALSSVPDAHYVDVFTLATDVAASPEQWARAMFGDAPDAGELFIRRGLLGLRISRRAGPDTVAGWRIGARGEHWIRLEAESWFLSANLVVRAADGRLSLATFVRYDRAVGRVVWPPLAAVHRRLVPGVLRDAATKRARAHRS